MAEDVRVKGQKAKQMDGQTYMPPSLVGDNSILLGPCPLAQILLLFNSEQNIFVDFLPNAENGSQ